MIPAILATGPASFSSDLTAPISWHASVETGGLYAASFAVAMSKPGIPGGFGAPVVEGLILQRTHGNRNTLICSMIEAAALGASRRPYLDPESAISER